MISATSFMLKELGNLFFLRNVIVKEKRVCSGAYEGHFTHSKKSVPYFFGARRFLLTFDGFSLKTK